MLRDGEEKSWFSSVKKVLSPDFKGKKAKKGHKSSEWVGNDKPSVSDSPHTDNVDLSEDVVLAEPESHPLLPLEDVKLGGEENEQTEHAYTPAAAAAEAAAAAAAEAASKIVQRTIATQFAGKSEEEVAAIKIQTAFRGYLARMVLPALRGLVRLKLLVDGPTAKRQTSNSMKCMQTLSRVQSQVQARRLRMLEENRALQRQLLQKHAKELESLRMGEEWDDSLQSQEQIEANMLHKYEAAMRRERALAYSFTHQRTWKKTAKCNNLLFMDPTNPHWGWSWLERWRAARAWDSQSTADKDLNIDRLSIKSGVTGTAGGEITKSYARHLLNSDSPLPATQKPPTQQSPATPPKARKLKPPSPRASGISQDDDTRSMVSMQSERNRRHTIAGSSIRDDESFTSSASVPSYMVPTKSTKAKSRLPSPLGMENGNTPDKSSAVSVKKRLSFPPSPARPRRHSVPPKMDTSSIPNDDKNGVAEYSSAIMDKSVKGSSDL